MVKGWKDDLGSVGTVARRENIHAGYFSASEANYFRSSSAGKMGETEHHDVAFQPARREPSLPANREAEAVRGFRIH